MMKEDDENEDVRDVLHLSEISILITTCLSITYGRIVENILQSSNL